MPRVRRASLVVTFPTTAMAMACEEACAAGGLPGRMIPVPGQVSAGCGLAWKAPLASRDKLAAGLAAAGVRWEGMFEVEMMEFERA